MLRKSTWVLAALLTALALVFFGCGDGGGGDPGGEPGGSSIGGFQGLDPLEDNPVVEGANYLRVTQRTASWGESIDIRAGKGGGGSGGDPATIDNWTANKAHTVTVHGATAEGGDFLYFTQTDSPYNSYTTTIKEETAYGFTLTREFSWAEISANQNIRIRVEPITIAFYVFEIIVEDEDGTVKYKLSEDDVIQAVETNSLLPSDDVVWLQKAGDPIVAVMVPGAEVGWACECEECIIASCDCEEGDCPDDCGECCNPPAFEPNLTAWNAETGMALTVGQPWSTTPISWVANGEYGTNYILREPGSNGFISIDLPNDVKAALVENQATTSLKITYIAAFVDRVIGDAASIELTGKQPGAAEGQWNDLSPALYASFEQTKTTLTLAGTRYASGYGFDKIYFQDNTKAPATTKWVLKIISIEADPPYTPNPVGDIAIAAQDGAALNPGVTLEATYTKKDGETVTYQWYKDGAAISGATNATYTTTASGTYKVRVTITGGTAFKDSSELVVLPGYDPEYDFSAIETALSLSTGDIISLGAKTAGNQWVIDDSNTTGALKREDLENAEKLVIVFGNPPWTAGSYLQVAIQFLDAANVGAGGKGWANHSGLDGAGAASGAIVKGTAGELTYLVITLSDTAKSYITEETMEDGDPAVEYTIGGIQIQFNTSYTALAILGAGFINADE